MLYLGRGCLRGRAGAARRGGLFGLNYQGPGKMSTKGKEERGKRVLLNLYGPDKSNLVVALTLSFVGHSL